MSGLFCFGPGAAAAAVNDLGVDMVPAKGGQKKKKED